MPEINQRNQHLFDNYTIAQQEKLYDALAAMLSDNRRQLFDRLAEQRTRHVCVVIEDIFQPHNASAVLRSCDCFGVQDVHIIEQHNRYTPSSEVAMGSNKWVDYYKYTDTLQAYKQLRDRGYRIVATTPHDNDTLINQLDITQPIALVFGTELTGLTQTAINNADGFVKIPMYGFTESFNISVSAALSLFSVTERMRSTPGIDWKLSPAEQLKLKLYWSLQTLHNGMQILPEIIRRCGLD